MGPCRLIVNGETDLSTGETMSRPPGPEITQLVRARLTAPRWLHTVRVMDTAAALATTWAVDADKAMWAALLHDAMRDEPPDQLLLAAERYGLVVDRDTMYRPVLLHGPVAAAWAKNALGVTDEAILEAIARHTLGAPGMGRLAALIYVSDACEPGRDYNGVEEVRQAARAGQVREACYLCADGMIRFLLEHRQFIHPQAVATRNWYLEHE